jgi:hypothetical protein
MKTSKILLRVAAFLMLIHGLGHTIGHSGWKKSTDTIQQGVIQQMTGPKFPFMGVTRSMGEYFDGYGYACSIAMMLCTLVLWFTSGELYGSPGLAKKMMLTMGICLLGWGVDEIIFFFPFAAGTSLLAGACALGAFFLHKPENVAVPELAV